MADWQPLPPRRKISKITVGTNDDVSDGIQARSSSHNPLDPQKNGSSNMSSNTNLQPSISISALSNANDKEERHQSIEENIAARSHQRWAEQSLASKDGCASEFYEYLDHTADVQFHTWGINLTSAFENMVPCMFNYMTDLEKVAIDPLKTIHLTVKGHDLYSLLYAYMDEFLYQFCTEGFCCKEAKITQFDREAFEITVDGYGEAYDLSKHPQGTEVKAITYSNMQIHESEERVDLHVIVDI